MTLERLSPNTPRTRSAARRPSTLPLFELPTGLLEELLERIAGHLPAADFLAFALASHACAAAARRAVGVAVTAEVARRLRADAHAGLHACAKCPAMVLPSVGLTSIGNASFDGTALISLTLPAGITSIGECAFCDCTYLADLTLPASLISIDTEAFWMCSALTSIALPASITSIGNYAFADCTALNSLILPVGITSVAKSLFYKCTALASVTLPDGLTHIGQFSFYRCSSLTTINIPASVQEIDFGAFAHCSSLDAATRARISAISANAIWFVKLLL